jgi:hypothetical protein
LQKSQAFQAYRLSNRWTPTQSNPGPPRVGGYGGSSSNSLYQFSRGLAAGNSEFQNLSAKAIENAYKQLPSLPVTGTNFEVEPWSLAKHVQHAPDFGLNPYNYGMTYADLQSIADIGLINQIRAGKTPPNAQFVKDFQLRYKLFTESHLMFEKNNDTVMGKSCTSFKNLITGVFTSFRNDSNNSFTGYKLTPLQSLRHDNYNRIGRNY